MKNKTYKYCPSCKETKLRTEFNRRSNGQSVAYCRICASAKSLEYSRSNPAIISRRMRKSKYRLTKEEMAKVEQTEQCELCKKTFQSTRHKHVDHDHKTKRFRGVLCAGCNTGLGRLGDSVEGLQRAIAYLSK